MADTTLTFDIFARDRASRAFNDVGNSADNAKSRLGGLAKAAASLFAAKIGSDWIRGAVDEAREAEKVTRLTEAAIKSTGGVANVTAAEMEKLAGRLSNVAAVDDELIQNAGNVLLTFTKVRNEVGKGNAVFDKAAEAALNMSAALGSDLQSATMQVGKALNDPVKGVTALTRAGVQFTKQQKEQIAALVESGDLLGAQKVILGELETQFGGAAAAAADPTQRLQVAMANLQESAGKLLLPVLEKLASGLAKLATWATENMNIVGPLAVVVGGALTAAFVAWGIAATQAAAATIAATWPVIAIGAAIAALVAGVIYAYNHWDVFRNAVDAVARSVAVGWDWIKRITGVVVELGRKAVQLWLDWTPLGQVFQNLPRILGVVRDAFGWVIAKVQSLIEWIGKLPGKIDKALGPLDELIGKAGGAIGGVGGFFSDAAGFLGFDTGGIVPGPIGKPVLAVVHGGETILPTHKNPAAGAQVTVQVNADAMPIEQVIESASRHTGWALSLAGGV